MWGVGLLVTSLVSIFIGLYAQSQSNVINQILPGLQTDHSTVTITGTATITSASTSVLTTTVTLQSPTVVTLAGAATSRTLGAGADQVRFTNQAGVQKTVDLVNGRYSVDLTNGQTYTVEVHYPGYAGGWSTAVTFKLAVGPNVPMPIEYDFQI